MQVYTADIVTLSMAGVVSKMIKKKQGAAKQPPNVAGVGKGKLILPEKIKRELKKMRHMTVHLIRRGRRIIPMMNGLIVVNWNSI